MLDQFFIKNLSADEVLWIFKSTKSTVIHQIGYNRNDHTMSMKTTIDGKNHAQVDLKKTNGLGFFTWWIKTLVD